MKFKTEPQKKTYEKTRGYLHTLFGEVNVTTMDEMLVLQEGSTFVYARAFPIGDKKAGVEVFAHVVADVAVTEELMRYLLTYNLRLIFGAFGLAIGEDGKATVVLSHSILGDSMSRDELYASVSAIARVADDLDDPMVKAFGGQTARDKLMATGHAPAEYWE